MVHKEEKTELGTVKIHNEVISAIASMAACEVKGVAKMAGSLATGLYDLISKKQFHKGVKVENLGGNEVKITVYIMVNYGVSIPYVANQVQESVRKNVETMTGLAIADVDVSVHGVTMPAKRTIGNGGGNETTK